MHESKIVITIFGAVSLFAIGKTCLGKMSGLIFGAMGEDCACVVVLGCLGRGVLCGVWFNYNALFFLLYFLNLVCLGLYLVLSRCTSGQGKVRIPNNKNPFGCIWVIQD